MELHGALAQALSPALLALSSFVLVAALGFLGAPLLVWTVALAAWLWLLGTPVWLLVVLALPALLFNLTPLRRRFVSAPLLGWMKRKQLLPTISDTERTALEAGTVWVDKDLFSGKPSFRKLMDEPYPGLTAEEQAFLDGPVEELCRMVDDWQVWQRRDLPPEAWDYVKKHRFLGIIIPKEYGGLGFSASANSAVVKKLASRSLPLSISVMVPNSLGPAELLIHYGTQAQRDHWLPRLARGEDIPCFALTEPGAGSDAGSLTSNGVVFRGDDGKLYLRLTWNKRYISLAAISTVLGLAIKLKDQDNLLGKGQSPGITCVLLPTSTPGVNVSRRHDALGVPFYNCPTEGRDVVVPIDCIIGGPDGAGQGWRMLTECLAAGRGISLPGGATGGVCALARVAGAHAAIRKQFGMPIGKFEGIEEPLARIGGFAYLLEAARRYTCGGLDRGAKPAVVTAIAKYNFTELARKAINDGMDVLGGNAISRGPRNLLAHGYIGAPISITVEGANILTRTLMIFGQGAIRCHPYAWAEIKALEQNDAAGFDKAFWAHVGHVVRNGSRSVLLSVTRGWLAPPPVSGYAAPFFRKLAWASASFAFLADLAMAGLGGNLKRKEAITGRFADIFSWLYLGTATLRRFLAEGQRPEDRPFAGWAMQYALGRIQEAFDGLYQNLRLPGLGWLLRGPVAVWSRVNRIGAPPADWLGHKVAAAMQVPGEQRDRLSAGLYLPSDPEQAAARLDRAFVLCAKAEDVARKIKDAVKQKILPKEAPEKLLALAQEKSVISAAEAELVREAEMARASAVAVDSFTLQEYLELGRVQAVEEKRLAKV